MESKKYWILTCDTNRYDIHTLFKKDGFCLWNQRAACSNKEEQLRERAAELCQYIPDHELLEKSKDYIATGLVLIYDDMPELSAPLTIDENGLFTIHEITVVAKQ